MHPDSPRNPARCVSLEDFEVSIPIPGTELDLKMSPQIHHHAIIIEQRVIAIEQKHGVMWCFQVTYTRIRLALPGCYLVWF
jgi:hypothetical protein